MQICGFEIGWSWWF